MLRWRIEDAYLFVVWFNRYSWLVRLDWPSRSHTGTGKWSW